MALMCAVPAAWAQTATTTIEEEVVQNSLGTNKRVITNTFWGNWFVSAGAGAQISFTDHAKQLDFGDRISPSLQVAVGKWFTPGIGVRLAYNGLSSKGATQTWNKEGAGIHSTGKPVDGKFTHDYGYLCHSKFNYLNLHLDVMFNLCQMIGGYNPQRLYSLIPYAGIGWAHVMDSPRQNEIAVNAGISNTFRLCDRLDLNFDINAMIVDDRFSSDTDASNRHFDALLGATLGITYKLGHKGWEYPTYTTRTVYNNDAVNDLRAQMAELENQNRKLADQLANQPKGDRVAELIASGNVIFFDIDKWDISEYARTNLKFLASSIKDAHTGTVYTVTGYADKGTGKPERNETLSKNRAQAAYDVLVNEFGIDPSQLEIHYKGGVDDMFFNDPRCSRCVIIIPKK